MVYFVHHTSLRGLKWAIEFWVRSENKISKITHLCLTLLSGGNDFFCGML